MGATRDMLPPVEWLNYNHLYYFWVVAREGGVTAAGKVLKLSHPTISAQIHALEDRLGEQLFVRAGRKLELTEVGTLVYRYADEIFSVGRELLDAVRGRPSGRPLRLAVGVADAVPKLIVRRLLQPALTLPEPIHIVCTEDRHERLLSALASHALDIVISDAPVPPGSAVRAYSHLLGETGVGVFGVEALARKYKADFPRSLDGAPMLLPLEQSSLRRELDQWFEKLGVRPRVVGEFEDSALLKVFGGDGVGLFVGPRAVERELKAQYGVAMLGRVEGVRERFYAISAERRIKHPAVLAISSEARTKIFAPATRRP